LIKLKDGKPKEVISKRRNSKKSESFNVILENDIPSRNGTYDLIGTTLPGGVDPERQ